MYWSKVYFGRKKWLLTIVFIKFSEYNTTGHLTERSVEKVKRERNREARSEQNNLVKKKRERKMRLWKRRRKEWEYFNLNKLSWDHNCCLAVIYSLINMGNGAQGQVFFFFFSLFHWHIHKWSVRERERENQRERLIDDCAKENEEYQAEMHNTEIFTIIW